MVSDRSSTKAEA